jgi:ketosteroid isomerase-like protein
MKKIFTLGLAAALTAGAVFAQTIDRQAALDSMVAAEKAFAKMAGEKGFRDAFLDFLADDSIVFRPDPVPAKEWYRGRPASPALLSWYPTFAEVSLAGDLGYTAGPWEYRAKGKDDPEVAATGTFVTLWRKQADGTWKALIDHGTENPKPASAPAVSIPSAQPAKIETSALPKANADAERSALLAADRAFGKAAEKGSAAAYLGVLADQARLHREGHEPFVGSEAIRAALAADAAPMTWEPAGGVVASSGDLGSTYGIAKRREGGTEGAWLEADNYFRIWKRQQPQGSWKLVLEVLTPRPKPVEKPVEKKPSGG